MGRRKLRIKSSILIRNDVLSLGHFVGGLFLRVRISFFTNTSRKMTDPQSKRFLIPFLIYTETRTSTAFQDRNIFFPPQKMTALSMCSFWSSCKQFLIGSCKKKKRSTSSQKIINAFLLKFYCFESSYLMKIQINLLKIISSSSWIQLLRWGHWSQSCTHTVRNQFVGARKRKNYLLPFPSNLVSLVLNKIKLRRRIKVWRMGDTFKFGFCKWYCCRVYKI